MTAKCKYDNIYILTMSLWDIDLIVRFQFLRSVFYRGSAGCLLFFDGTEVDLNYLGQLICEVRAYVGNIPIFLVEKSTQNSNIYISGIDNFVEENCLSGYYRLPDQESLILNELGRIIVNNHLLGRNNEKSNQLVDNNRKNLNDFLNFFSICPVCGNRNHRNYLVKFFFSKNPNSIILKKKLLELMEKSKEFGEIYINKIKLGIPCCDCFKNFL